MQSTTSGLRIAMLAITTLLVGGGSASAQPRFTGRSTGICVTVLPNGHITHRPCGSGPPSPPPTPRPRRPAALPPTAAPAARTEAERRLETARRLVDQCRYYASELSSLYDTRERLSAETEPLYWENEDLAALLDALKKEFERGYAYGRRLERDTDVVETYAARRRDLLAEAYGDLLDRLEKLEAPRFLVFPGILPGASESFPSLTDTVQPGVDLSNARALVGSAPETGLTNTEELMKVDRGRARSAGCAFITQYDTLLDECSRSPHYVNPWGVAVVAIPAPGGSVSESELARIRGVRDLKAKTVMDVYEEVVDRQNVQDDLRWSVTERRWEAEQYRGSILELYGAQRPLSRFIEAKGREILLTEAKRVTAREVRRLIERYVPAGARDVVGDAEDEFHLLLNRYGRYVEALNRMRRFAEIVTDRDRFQDLTAAMWAATYTYLDPERATAVGEQMERSFGLMAHELQDLGMEDVDMALPASSWRSIWSGKGDRSRR